MEIKTELLSSSDEDIKKAAGIIKHGGVVGMPTETVYGLAADAADSKAVEKIFIAKGRPQDNPLIVHIADISDFERIRLRDTRYRIYPRRELLAGASDYGSEKERYHTGYYERRARYGRHTLSGASCGAEAHS